MARSILLYSGGELFINRLGGLWHVDVFADGTSAELVYHAAYATREEADADAAKWRKWDED